MLEGVTGHGNGRGTGRCNHPVAVLSVGHKHTGDSGITNHAIRQQFEIVVLAQQLKE